MIVVVMVAKGNGGKSKNNSFWVFVLVVTVATEK